MLESPIMSLPVPSFHHHHPYLVSVPKPNSTIPISFPKRSHFNPRPAVTPRPSTPTTVKSSQGRQKNNKQNPLPKPRWENALLAAASLYPVYITFGGAVACVKPAAFSWFVERGPASYSSTLGFIMLAMGLTLEFKDFFCLLRQRPFSILFGCASQYIIMPVFGLSISKALRLPPSLTVGLVLLACCPGGTASNVVTLIAQGDVALSIVMTSCTTLAAVFLTPLLTKILAGAIVPVDAVKLSISTLQVVVAPILIGSYMQSKFPNQVKLIMPFAPLLAVLASSLLASSVFSENLVRIKASLISASNGSDISQIAGVAATFSGNLGVVILSVILLHFMGFFVGYLTAAICGFKERQRRAISIEVGMQNSSLGVVLAVSHFTSPLVTLPCAMSAVIMNIMGSSLGFIWRHVDPPNDKN